MLSSKRSRVTAGIIVGVIALAGWGLTNAINKVQLAAARTDVT